MDTSFSMVAQSELERVLDELFPAARGYKHHTQHAAGGFVVALIHPDLAKADEKREREFLDRVGKVNSGIAEARDRIAIFTVIFRSTERELYSEEAILRAVESSYERGVLVIHATAQDVPVLAHAVDAEALLIDPGALASCRVIPEEPPELAGLRLSTTRYAEFELAGVSFPVDQIKAMQNNEWQVELS